MREMHQLDGSIWNKGKLCHLLSLHIALPDAAWHAGRNARGMLQLALVPLPPTAQLRQ
jgi:hypothetical protein